MRDDHRLKLAAAQIAEELRREKNGFPLRMASPGKILKSPTDGWFAPLAYMPNKGACLDVWIDRFAGQKERTFWTGFFHRDEKVIRNLVNKVRTDWPVVLELGEDDLSGDWTARMKKPLPVTKFGAQVAEHYAGCNYFGFYHRLIGPAERVNSQFCRKASDFFLDVIDRFRGEEDSTRDENVYPRLERVLVKSHLARERSRFLASYCKERDGYQCKVCEMSFEDVYGPIGCGFAEAHHRQALATLDPSVPTKPEDLVTVCANCHRMLHRMKGEKGDLQKLREIVRKRWR